MSHSLLQASGAIIKNVDLHSENDIVAAMRHMTREGVVEVGWDYVAVCKCSFACLRYLVSINYPHKSCCSVEHAVKYGILELLAFLHENGWPIPNCIFWRAMQRGHYDCASYLHNNGHCSYGCFDHSEEYEEEEYKQNLREVARFILLPKWRAVTKSRSIAMYWWDQSGISSYAENGLGRKRDFLTFQSEFTTTSNRH